MSWGFSQTFMSMALFPAMLFPAIFLVVLPPIFAALRPGPAAFAFVFDMDGIRTLAIFFAVSARFTCNLLAEAFVVAQRSCSSRPLTH